MRIFGMTVMMLGAAFAQQNCSCAQTSVDSQRILRVIQDPGAHSVWLLRVDPLHPAGPGTLVEIKATAPTTQISHQSSLTASTTHIPSATPLIHSGDRVSIEQHTAHIDSSLSGVALEPAYANSSFRLRLVGGQLLRAIAIDAHKARLIAQSTAAETRSAQP